MGEEEEVEAELTEEEKEQFRKIIHRKVIDLTK
jgi:hypothetical protein